MEPQQLVKALIALLRPVEASDSAALISYFPPAESFSCFLPAAPLIWSSDGISLDFENSPAPQPIEKAENLHRSGFLEVLLLHKFHHSSLSSFISSFLSRLAASTCREEFFEAFEILLARFYSKKLPLPVEYSSAYRRFVYDEFFSFSSLFRPLGIFPALAWAALDVWSPIRKTSEKALQQWIKDAEKHLDSHTIFARLKEFLMIFHGIFSCPTGDWQFPTNSSESSGSSAALIDSPFNPAIPIHWQQFDGLSSLVCVIFHYFYVNFPSFSSSDAFSMEFLEDFLSPFYSLVKHTQISIRENCTRLFHDFFTFSSHLSTEGQRFSRFQRILEDLKPTGEGFPMKSGDFHDFYCSDITGEGIFSLLDVFLSSCPDSFLLLHFPSFFPVFARYLGHPASTVRQKCANLIGNLGKRGFSGDSRLFWVFLLQLNDFWLAVEGLGTFEVKNFHQWNSTEKLMKNAKQTLKARDFADETAAAVHFAVPPTSSGELSRPPENSSARPFSHSWEWREGLMMALESFFSGFLEEIERNIEKFQVSKRQPLGELLKFLEIPASSAEDENSPFFPYFHELLSISQGGENLLFSYLSRSLFLIFFHSLSGKWEIRRISSALAPTVVEIFLFLSPERFLTLLKDFFTFAPSWEWNFLSFLTLQCLFHFVTGFSSHSIPLAARAENPELMEFYENQRKSSKKIYQRECIEFIQGKIGEIKEIIQKQLEWSAEHRKIGGKPENSSNFLEFALFSSLDQYFTLALSVVIQYYSIFYDPSKDSGEFLKKLMIFLTDAIEAGGNSEEFEKLPGSALTAALGNFSLASFNRRPLSSVSQWLCREFHTLAPSFSSLLAPPEKRRLLLALGEFFAGLNLLDAEVRLHLLRAMAHCLKGWEDGGSLTGFSIAGVTSSLSCCIFSLNRLAGNSSLHELHYSLRILTGAAELIATGSPEEGPAFAEEILRLVEKAVEHSIHKKLPVIPRLATIEEFGASLGGISIGNFQPVQPLIVEDCSKWDDWDDEPAPSPSPLPTSLLRSDSLFDVPAASANSAAAVGSVLAGLLATPSVAMADEFLNFLHELTALIAVPDALIDSFTALHELLDWNLEREKAQKIASPVGTFAVSPSSSLSPESQRVRIVRSSFSGSLSLSNTPRKSPH